MAILKCKMCGGDLNIEEEVTVWECEYCGSKQTVPVVDDEKKLKLYDRANKLRSNCEFDKAAGVYENIVSEFSDEAEGYWGLILCRYGIEYVDDPITGKKIPTCHRSSFDSIMDDEDFEMVMENSDSVSRVVYREEAKYIEEIRKGIIEVSGKEEPYDIFICYKETDENGERTLDSVLAQDVYEALTDKGYRVFFSRISLEDKLGVEYEPYIFAALNSAKIMLAFGTSYDYYNAVWVKNEWSRYLKLMAKDKSKHLIPCFKNVDAYDIPKEFAKLQAQDMGKVGAIQDLVRGIEKIVGKKDDTALENDNKTIVMTNAPSNVDLLLERVFIFLEDSEWKSAGEYCEKVLDIDPKNAQAYLGKLMVDLQVTKKELLSSAKIKIDSAKNYARTYQYADENLKKELLYAIAKQLQNSATRIQDYTQVIAAFETIRGYKDSESMMNECAKIIRSLQEKELFLKADREKADRASKFIQTGEYSSYLLRLDGTVIYCGTDENGESDVERWQDIVSLSGSEYCKVGLRTNGTVVSCGINVGSNSKISSWRDIVAISGSDTHTVGLKSNGTVVFDGDDNSGEGEVNEWQDIVAIVSQEYHTLGLKKNGRVVACGDNENEACNVGMWNDIISIFGGYDHNVGLKADRTVVACGDNTNGQCDVNGWNDVVSVLCLIGRTIGLKIDGTVVACGHNYDGACNVNEWKDIIAISGGNTHTVGLKKDGTVVACGDNEYGQCDVKQWSDIVAISAGGEHTIGLRSDGTVVACGSNEYGQCDVEGYRLFGCFEKIEEEKRMLDENQAEHKRREQKRLQEEKEKEEKRRIEAQQRRKELQDQKLSLLDELNSLGFFQMKEKQAVKEKIEMIESKMKRL